MTKKMLRRIAAVVLALIMVAGTMLTAYAETSSQYVPYESYTYWNDISGTGRKLVYNRTMFETAGVYTASDLGASKVTELVDVCTDDDGKVYLLDTGSTDALAKIIVLNSDYTLNKEIDRVYRTKDDGTVEELTFTGAQSVYVHSDFNIYLCDSANARVLQFDIDGNYIDEYTLPDSPLIPSEFTFKPVKVTADSRGYVYVLSEGSYYGALLYAPATSGTAKEFIGFYGANDVTTNILGTIQAVLNRMFPNNEKSANSARTLPYAFSDIVIDSRDFVYTATDSTTKGQLKKLNPGAGSNILDSDDVRFIDDAVNRTYGTTAWSYTQKVTGVAVDENDFIYALDIAYGRIFVYDEECRMVTAFGGGLTNGSQEGSFLTASAMDLKGDEVLVTDKLANTLTVFRRNDYGTKVLELTRMTLDGDYIESREGWEEVLSLDRNLQIAYTGLARAYLQEGKYKEAMDMAYEGYDRDTYALAYEYYRTEVIDANFTWIFLAIVAVLAAIIAVVVVRARKRAKAGYKYDEPVIKVKNRTQLALSTLLHPGAAFEEIKDKKRGSFRVATVILLIYYVSAVLETLWGGFLFTNYDPGTFNSLWVFVQSAGLVALFVVANWLVTTLMGGKGKTKEIYVVTCYSLMPMIVERVIYIILSNILLPDEASFLSILAVVGMIYTGLLLIIGMMRIHDFSMGRFLGSTLLTVLGMAAIIFLIILVAILLQQLGGFVVTIVVELLM